MDFTKLKKDKKRFATSIFIILFYLIYFFVGAVTSEWVDKYNYIWISNLVFLIINILVLSLINFELLNIYNFNKKKFVFLQIISYFSIILMYIIPFSFEIGDYFPYKHSVDLRWMHNWFLPLAYFMFFLIYSLTAVFSKNIGFKNIVMLFLLTLFVMVCVKSMTIIMLHSGYGWSSLLYLFLIVIFTDTFAYLGGLLFGKRKMAPTISPNKTFEGLITGLVFGSVIPMLFAIGLYVFLPSYSLKYLYAPFLSQMPVNNEISIYFIYISFSIVLSLISQFGDLFFSAIKRKFNVKDFSNILPGHGGILDRLDSILIVAFFAFIFTRLIQVI